MTEWQPKSWSWWYTSIIDLMLGDPSLTKKDIAEKLGVHQVTIGLITRSDLFQEHLAKRRARFEQMQHATIIHDTTAVVTESTKHLLRALEKKRDSVPIETLLDIRTSALEQLGYGRAASPAVQINNLDNRKVTVAVNASAIAEARDAMRAAERARALSPPQPMLTNEPREFVHAERDEREGEGEDGDEGVQEGHAPFGLRVGSAR